MQTTKDTPLPETKQHAGKDPKRTGGGSTESPGGANAPADSASEMTQGQEGYPGPRPDGAAEMPSTPPVAADTDPDSTASADETGQAGTDDRPGKDKGHPWNG